ncbi:membrane protein [Niallia circulans]|jgi:hypothetical protein|uniref:DUF4257 domain-containing protein n=1 Tax=Niallia circulans TaxID=1397 RepID=A0A0J1HV58_NIACI|nr:MULTISPECIES: DUF4257 domain-containing protein [Bacillaceae]EOR22378.1 putative membrane protein [Niallia nealsonii AAU1]MDU1847199.1 DUF4257 domain-containing protein [Niallia nealsonii]SLL35316.1 Uncharacterised protein [Mycobacteroides abscessus subsp. abscessus]HEO8421562.1 DUF4257 domain-containing protein [Yersinia enterocolitica]KAB7670260.1 DUF4257 domain-containing protein [Bacillus sp. B1-b2]
MLNKIILAGCIGFGMGVLTHAKRYGTIKKPRNNKLTFYPGFLLDGCFGAVGAIVTILFSDPNGTERVILTSILGGYVGENAIIKVEESLQSKKESRIEEINRKINQDL